MPYTKFDYFGIIRLCCGQTNKKQTDKQTDGLERSTHAERQRVGVGNTVVRRG